MIASLRGKVEQTGKGSIILETHGVGYEVLLSHPDNFLVGSERYLKIIDFVTETSHFLVGFEDDNEKNLFCLLLKVKGIGVKTALNILSGSNPYEIRKAIVEGNIIYLKSLPGVGIKAASQIVLDLKNKVSIEEKTGPSLKSDLHDALRGLGFLHSEVERALMTVNIKGKTFEEALKSLLSFLKG